MTDGIGRIFGGNSYGVGGYVPQRKEETLEENTEQQVVYNAEQQVDPSKVMDFLSANNFFVAPANETKSVDGMQADPQTEERIAGYMENFEMIYGLIVDEFGEKVAPTVMDMVMDALICQMAA